MSCRHDLNPDGRPNIRDQSPNTTDQDKNGFARNVNRRRSGSGRSVSSLIRKLSRSKNNSNIYTKGLIIPKHCKFKLAVQTVKPELTVSFTLADMPGFALACNKTDDVYAEKIINDIKFWERCSFIPSINLWYDGFCAFESVREASRYLLHVDGRFYFKKYDGTQQFKKNASFLFTKANPVFLPRRSKSNIIPPDPNKLQINKTRKFSLMSFRPHSARTTFVPVASELQRMLLSEPKAASKTTESNKTEMYSLGFNKCADCLTLTNFRYIGSAITKEERLTCESSGASSNSTVTIFLEPPECEVFSPVHSPACD